MDEAYERLTQASHQVAAALYQSAGPQEGETAGGPAAAQEPEQTAADEGVIDAEYVDVDAEETK